MTSAALDARLAHLDTISLDELLDVAALQTRVDRKYALPRDAADALLASSAADTRVLEIDGVRAAAYESVYFDTPELLSYRMAAHARRRRFKLRTRSYLDSRQAYLEMKTRGARSATVKERIEYDIRNRSELTPDGRDYADTALDGLGLPHVGELALSPTLTTRYLRTTLYLPASRSRATVDVELAWRRERGPALARPDLVIIETKSGSRTSGLDRLLWSHGHRPATLSKYGTGMAALDPDLPSNRWARVLRRHFS